MAKRKMVIALGGNAIQTSQHTAEAQQHALEMAAEQLADLIGLGYAMIISHGNGPQVGNLLLQQKAAASLENPAMPLDTCDAMTQGMIGYWMENALEKALRERGIYKNIVTIVTRVVVNQNDPAFKNPTKPIGPFYSKEEADRQQREEGAIFMEDAGRGWRRVIPSPKPVDILEHKIIHSLMEDGDIVISTGGGGIPVIETEEGFKGVEAVIDKDFASQKLAELVHADILLILTAVDYIFLDFNKPTRRRLENIQVDELKRYMAQGQFAPGSMLPKVQAAIQFAESSPERKTIITSLDKAFDAVNGRAGTVISLYGSNVLV